MYEVHSRLKFQELVFIKALEYASKRLEEGQHHRRHWPIHLQIPNGQGVRAEGSRTDMALSKYNVGTTKPTVIKKGAIVFGFL